MFEVVGRRKISGSELFVYSSLGNFHTLDEASKVKADHESIYEKVDIFPHGTLPYEKRND